jgi:hypothetical protein
MSILSIPLPVWYAGLACICLLIAWLLFLVAYFPGSDERIIGLLDELYRLLYGACHTWSDKDHHRSRKHGRDTKKG